ncbi:restriction endonuclease subunit S [Streptomyces sp. NPDC057729]|uniref:restriction endonuclease subunit S n=1 Tax=Streptomyces sp. NPDC057729 TaxID=3346230 RepID=UPI0036A46A13
MNSALKQLPYGASPPGSWNVVPLKYLATLSNGYVFKSDGWTDTGTPIIRIENLNGSENFNYSNLALGAKYHVHPGNLLFSWSGNPGTSFGPFRWKNPGLHFLNQHIFNVSVHGCDKDWLYWSLRAATHWIERVLTSGMIGMVHVTKEELSSTPIPVPPPEEQRRIAAFLDAETAQIDRLMELRRRQLEGLKERYNVAISELAIPGISSDCSRSQLWPWLPASIPTTRLGQIARIQSGVTVHGARERTRVDAEYPYLRVANVQGERVDLSEIKTIAIPAPMAVRSTLRTGDVVMTEANGNPDNLGRGAVWHGEIPEMVHQNHIFAIRVNSRKLTPEFLTLLLASAHGRRYFRFTSSQVGIATTSTSKVLSFPVPVRSLEEQHTAVSEYQQARAQTGRAADALNRQLTLLAERRQSLITAAVTGQIDVSTASGRGIDPS